MERPANGSKLGWLLDPYKNRATIYRPGQRPERIENPGILSIPLGFLGAFLGTILSHEPTSEHKFNELLVRSNTGLGAERASAH